MYSIDKPTCSLNSLVRLVLMNAPKPLQPMEIWYIIRQLFPYYNKKSVSFHLASLQKELNQISVERRRNNSYVLRWPDPAEVAIFLKSLNFNSLKHSTKQEAILASLLAQEGDVIQNILTLRSVQHKSNKDIFIPKRTHQQSKTVQQCQLALDELTNMLKSANHNRKKSFSAAINIFNPLVKDQLDKNYSMVSIVNKDGKKQRKPATLVEENLDTSKAGRNKLNGIQSRNKSRKQERTKNESVCKSKSEGNHEKNVIYRKEGRNENIKCYDRICMKQLPSLCRNYKNSSIMESKYYSKKSNDQKSKDLEPEEPEVRSKLANDGKFRRKACANKRVDKISSSNKNYNNSKGTEIKRWSTEDHLNNESLFSDNSMPNVLHNSGKRNMQLKSSAVDFNVNNEEKDLFHIQEPIKPWSTIPPSCNTVKDCDSQEVCSEYKKSKKRMTADHSKMYESLRKSSYKECLKNEDSALNDTSIPNVSNDSGRRKVKRRWSAADFYISNEGKDLFSIQEPIKPLSTKSHSCNAEKSCDSKEVCSEYKKSKKRQIVDDLNAHEPSLRKSRCKEYRNNEEDSTLNDTSMPNVLHDSVRRKVKRRWSAADFYVNNEEIDLFPIQESVKPLSIKPHLSNTVKGFDSQEVHSEYNKSKKRRTVDDSKMHKLLRKSDKECLKNEGDSDLNVTSMPNVLRDSGRRKMKRRWSAADFYLDDEETELFFIQKSTKPYSRHKSHSSNTAKGYDLQVCTEHKRSKKRKSVNDSKMHEPFRKSSYKQRPKNEKYSTLNEATESFTKAALNSSFSSTTSSMSESSDRLIISLDEVTTNNYISDAEILDELATNNYISDTEILDEATTNNYISDAEILDEATTNNYISNGEIGERVDKRMKSNKKEKNPSNSSLSEPNINKSCIIDEQSIEEVSKTNLSEKINNDGGSNSRKKECRDNSCKQLSQKDIQLEPKSPTLHPAIEQYKNCHMLFRKVHNSKPEKFANNYFNKDVSNEHMNNVAVSTCNSGSVSVDNMKRSFPKDVSSYSKNPADANFLKSVKSNKAEKLKKTVTQTNKQSKKNECLDDPHSFQVRNPCIGDLTVTAVINAAFPLDNVGSTETSVGWKRRNKSKGEGRGKNKPSQSFKDGFRIPKELDIQSVFNMNSFLMPDQSAPVNYQNYYSYNMNPKLIRNDITQSKANKVTSSSVKHGKLDGWSVMENITPESTHLNIARNIRSEDCNSNDSPGSSHKEYLSQFLKLQIPKPISHPIDTAARTSQFSVVGKENMVFKDLLGEGSPKKEMFCEVIQEDIETGQLSFNNTRNIAPITTEKSNVICDVSTPTTEKLLLNVDSCIEQWKKIFKWMFYCKVTSSINCSFCTSSNPILSIHNKNDIFRVSYELRKHANTSSHVFATITADTYAFHSFLDGLLRCLAVSSDKNAICLYIKKLNLDACKNPLIYIEPIAKTCQKDALNQLRKGKIFSLIEETDRKLLMVRYIGDDDLPEEHLLINDQPNANLFLLSQSVNPEKMVIYSRLGALEPIAPFNEPPGLPSVSDLCMRLSNNFHIREYTNYIHAISALYKSNKQYFCGVDCTIFRTNNWTWNNLNILKFAYKNDNLLKNVFAPLKNSNPFATIVTKYLMSAFVGITITFINNISYYDCLTTNLLKCEYKAAVEEVLKHYPQPSNEMCEILRYFSHYVSEFEKQYYHSGHQMLRKNLHVFFSPLKLSCIRSDQISLEILYYVLNFLRRVHWCNASVLINELEIIGSRLLERNRKSNLCILDMLSYFKANNLCHSFSTSYHFYYYLSLLPFLSSKSQKSLYFISWVKNSLDEQFCPELSKNLLTIILEYNKNINYLKL